MSPSHETGTNIMLLYSPGLLATLDTKVEEMAVTWTSGWLQGKGLSWHEKLRQIATQTRAAQERAEPKPRLPDPWEARLIELKGEVNDGHERVPSFIVFDHLGLRRSERHSGAARRLARAMRHLGWERVRFQVRSGSFQRVRGFQRVARE